MVHHGQSWLLTAASSLRSLAGEVLVSLGHSQWLRDELCKESSGAQPLWSCGWVACSHVSHTFVDHDADAIMLMVVSILTFVISELPPVDQCRVTCRLVAVGWLLVMFLYGSAFTCIYHNSRIVEL